jgi:ribosome modulation factor
MSRPERKEEIIRIRQEGYDAAKAGKHVQSCPREYLHSTNQEQWETGYRNYQMEANKLRRENKIGRIADRVCYILNNYNIWKESEIERVMVESEIESIIEIWEGES